MGKGSNDAHGNGNGKVGEANGQPVVSEREEGTQVGELVVTNTIMEEHEGHNEEDSK